MSHPNNYAPPQTLIQIYRPKTGKLGYIFTHRKTSPFIPFLGDNLGN